jgi:thioredoxin-related protein
MIKSFVMVCLAATAISAKEPFNVDSLVFTEGPHGVELVSLKAESQLKFVNDLDQAIKQAHIENKSLLVIIVGGKGCAWSEKLLFDVVYKPEFYSNVQKRFIICKLEVDELPSKGKELGLKDDLQNLPMFVLMTKDGKVIAETSDISEDPKEVINYLSSAMKASERIQLALKDSQINEGSLEELYLLAKSNGLKQEDELYELGIKKKKNIFFQLEKYKKLLIAGSNKEIKDLKLDIQRLDPRNLKGTIRKLAILDFEERSRQKRGMDNPFSALKPLFEYLRDYGHYDKECRWEIEMRIARFLFAKNQLQAAIQHASRSLEFAPEAKKSEVFEAVEFLKKQKQN